MKGQRKRREFVKESAAATVGYWVAGGLMAADSKSPNEKLNVAIIGAGGQGGGNLRNTAALGENIVALCDPDEERAKRAFENFPKARRFQDYRKLFDDMHREIDAVVVSTPDHNHAVASMMAIKHKKHVYCEKPLTHTVNEARALRAAAAENKVATQMGNHGTSHAGLRQAVEVIQSGAIGPVREAHVWTNRPSWPQGVPTPTETMAVPSTLNWDVWLGPAKERPYHKSYLPFNWRGWWDFGTGALGDMACHTANMAFMALKLGYPTAVEAVSSGFYGDSLPKWSVIRYDFPARGDMPALKWFWYDGGMMPSIRVMPAFKPAEGKKRPTSGSLLVGDKGTLYSPNDYGSAFELLPEADFKDYKAPKPWLPRSPGHHKEWILACKGGPAAMSNFDYAALLTETVLLGNIALAAGKRIEWDGPNMRATNCPEAEQWIKPEYRSGWSL